MIETSRSFRDLLRTTLRPEEVLKSLLSPETTPEAFVSLLPLYLDSLGDGSFKPAETRSRLVTLCAVPVALTEGASHHLVPALLRAQAQEGSLWQTAFQQAMGSYLAQCQLSNETLDVLVKWESAAPREDRALHLAHVLNLRVSGLVEAEADPALLLPVERALLKLHKRRAGYDRSGLLFKSLGAFRNRFPVELFDYALTLDRELWSRAAGHSNTLRPLLVAQAAVERGRLSKLVALALNSVDGGLAMNPALPRETQEALWERYRSNPRTAAELLAPIEWVATILADDPSGVFGLSTRMDVLSPALRNKVAQARLEQFVGEGPKGESTNGLAGVYTELGDQAGERLVRYASMSHKNFVVDHIQAEHEATLAAILATPKKALRERLLGLKWRSRGDARFGAWYQNTVLPALLSDRARLVREQAARQLAELGLRDDATQGRALATLPLDECISAVENTKRLGPQLLDGLLCRPDRADTPSDKSLLQLIAARDDLSMATYQRIVNDALADDAVVVRVARALPKDNPASRALLDHIRANAGTTVMAVLAPRPEWTSEEERRSFVQHGDAVVRGKVASHPSLSYGEFLTLLHDVDPRVRASLVSGPSWARFAGRLPTS
jgi:hypothetical protein